MRELRGMKMSKATLTLLRMTSMSERQSARSREVNRVLCMLVDRRVVMARMVPMAPMMTIIMVSQPDMWEMMLSYNSDLLPDTPQVDSIFSSVTKDQSSTSHSFLVQPTYDAVKVALIVINANLIDMI